MKSIVLLFCMTVFTIGCGTTKYHLEISGRYDDFKQEYDGPTVLHEAPPFYISQASTFSLNGSGSGVQIGLLETSKITWARIGYYYSSISDAKFVHKTAVATPVSGTVDVVSHGLEWVAGFNIWWFKPYISINYLTSNFTYDNVALDAYLDNQPVADVLGGGVAFVVNLSEGTQLVLNAHQRQGTIAYSLGLAFYLGEVGGGDTSREDRRK